LKEEIMDSEMPSVSRHKLVIARKSHSCCECHRDIAIGERYQRINGCWEGAWSEFKTCMPCVDLRDELGRQDPIAFGGLEEAAQEYDEEFPPPRI